MEIFLLFAVLL